MPFNYHQLPAVNASLNATATVLLVIGYLLIKQRLERAHKWVMLAAFGVSVLFLVSYLTYHFALKSATGQGHVTFPGTGLVRPLYFGLLFSHIILATIVPILAVLTIYSGLKDRRARHIRLAKWTFPIWLYVSITGVVIYVMLYHLYAPQPPGSIIDTACSSRAIAPGLTT
jgi:uncharacterized membrane protein YozB (DUF420 family)